MSQKWIPRDHEIRIADVSPGEEGVGTFLIDPDNGRSFHLLSAVSVAGSFRLVQCHVGGKKLFRGDESTNDFPFPANGLFGTAEPGVAITLKVKNASTEKCTFVGKLVGEELEYR